MRAISSELVVGLHETPDPCYKTRWTRTSSLRLRKHTASRKRGPSVEGSRSGTVAPSGNRFADPHLVQVPRGSPTPREAPKRIHGPSIPGVSDVAGDVSRAWVASTKRFKDAGALVAELTGTPEDCGQRAA